MSVHTNQILHGDCIETLARIDRDSVELAFADPPFNIGYEYDVYRDDRESSEYVNWSKQWISSVHQVLKPSGTFWLAIGDEYAAELKVIAQQVGFVCRSWIIWYYTFGVNCARGFSRSHTHIFHFVKDPDDFAFNADNPAIRVPSARQLVYGDSRANPRGRLPDNTWIYRPQDGPPGAFSPNHDTWYFARVAGTFRERQGFHGCQMPEQLLGRIIRLSSRPGDIVLDPFGGSGTTLAVAKKLGRQWLGIELSSDYVQQIKRRLHEVNVGDDLDGPADPIKSAPASKNGKSKYTQPRGLSIPLPKADEDIQRGIVSAFKKASRGHSVDHLLCDPDLGIAFRQECKRLGLPGTAFFWNRILLRLRKQKGVLPKVTAKPKQFTFEQMDAYSFASEIAIRQLELDYALVTDDILCSPDAITEFDKIAQAFAPGHSEFEYRWAALAIRKRAKKSQRIGVEKFGKWKRKSKKLPETKPIKPIDLAEYKTPGTYIFMGRNDEQPLYVGETRNIANRILLIDKSEQWKKLGLSGIASVLINDRDLHGLQSVLVQRQKPWLNSHMLDPDSVFA